MKKNKILIPNKKEIESIFESMLPIKGERRAICQCDDCGKLFGRRFIPFGLGRGLTVESCLCQLTANRPFHIIDRREP